MNTTITNQKQTGIFALVGTPIIRQTKYGPIAIIRCVHYNTITKKQEFVIANKFINNESPTIYSDLNKGDIVRLTFQKKDNYINIKTLSHVGKKT